MVYVWAWLPAATSPVVCGGLAPRRDGSFAFTYGRSYLARPDAIALYDLPLGEGTIAPPPGQGLLHGALRDALPDAWGQHVIAATRAGRGVRDTSDVPLSAYMLESGSDRFGAVDFQESASKYVAREGGASMEELARAADDLEAGRPVPAAIVDAFEHGTSIGGARPKVTVHGADGAWIVKLSSSTDMRPAMKHEALALDLAERCGLVTPPRRRVMLRGRDALMIRRFDRTDTGARRMTVSALTMLRLDEMQGRYATYPELLDTLRAHGAAPEVGEELFTRVAVNIAVGNDDDHARNHAALWDGHRLDLSPVYDLDPRRSRGWDSNQAMAYGRDGSRESVLATLVRCHADYDLTRADAHDRVRAVVDTIRAAWDDAVSEAGLTREEGRHLLGSRVLAGGAVDGLR